MMKEIKEINSLGIKEFVSYKESDLEREGLFIAESYKVITRALVKNFEPVKLLIEDKMLETNDGKELLSMCSNAEIFFGTKEVLSNLVGYNLTCGALCLFKRKELLSLQELIKNKQRIVVLENVCNSMNVGSIFRNAAAFGYDALLLTKDSADPLTRRSIRVSMGNVFNIPYGFINSIDDVKSYGYKTVGMALRKNTISIDSPLLKTEQQLAILLGSEGPGLKETTIDNCDYVVKIPMANEVDSLNVSSASAVALWELTLSK